MEPTTVYLTSLGCPKNRVDSEVILGTLMSGGYEPVENPLEAQVIVVNTCSFIESATQESIDTILELAQAKESGLCRLLVVAGCLPQRYGRKLVESMPEVDLFVGTSSFVQLPALITNCQTGGVERLLVEPPRYLMTSQTPRALSAPFYRGYLKIAEGCDNRCTFCTIPAIRGPYRSRPLEDLLQEAEWLASEGVVELNLIAQDTTAYGSDSGNLTGLPDLLKALAKTNRFAWIRLLYGYPNRINHALLEVMKSHDCICDYLDLPFQHVSSRLLRAMGRAGSVEEFHRLVAYLRTSLPRITLRTTFMVGFPGETEADFQKLYDFVEQTRFHRLGIFTYSAERGTKAARMKNHVPEHIKKERLAVIADLQERISLDYHKRLLDTVQPVLIEGTSSETDLLLEGRLASQAPEVDGRVLINKGFGQVGKIMPVRITEAHPYDIVGEVVNPRGRSDLF
ncbi:MAG: 30S ribosomal protein S12 methylthiotransferase RimO [Deltaproteobacteria bacterium]|nr:MAG: 30S ribosomal protein S12 methylthiotransferase RimO [Deltaproteobacteria bacterium]